MSEAIERPSNVVPFRSVERPRSLKVNAKADEKVELYIYDEIGPWGIEAKDVIDALQEIDGEGKTLEIHINSPGGDVFDGVAISTAIANAKAKTVAHVDGLAASIASLIAISADEVVMPENAFFMIHNSWMWSVGNAKSLRESADTLAKIDERLLASYQKQATKVLGEGAGEIDFAQMMADETWLTGAESAAMGLCDTVSDAVQIAACVRPDIKAQFLNMPETLETSDPDQDDETETPEAETEAEVEAETQPEPEAEVEADEETEAEPEVEDETYKAEIRTLCALADKPEMAEEFIANKITFEDARAQIWDKKVEDDEAIETDSTAPVEAEPAAKKEGGLIEARRSELAKFSGQARY